MIELCKRGADGPFPNAYKLDPDKRTSWLIPEDEFNAYLAKINARAKAEEAKARA